MLQKWSSKNFVENLTQNEKKRWPANCTSIKLPILPNFGLKNPSRGFWAVLGEIIEKKFFFRSFFAQIAGAQKVPFVPNPKEHFFERAKKGGGGVSPRRAVPDFVLYIYYIYMHEYICIAI